MISKDIYKEPKVETNRPGSNLNAVVSRLEF